MHIFAGNGQGGFGGGGYALTVPIFGPSALAVDADDSVWVAAKLADVIFRLRDQLPGAGKDTLVIASADGAQLYEFSANGRHLRTRDAHSGETVYSFRYTSDGQLSELEDAYGNITGVERGAEGEPLGMEGLEEIVSHHVGGPDELIGRVFNGVYAHASSEEPLDDIAMVAFRMIDD